MDAISESSRPRIRGGGGCDNRERRIQRGRVWSSPRASRAEPAVHLRIAARLDRKESAGVPAARCIRCERLLMITVPPDAPDAEVVLRRAVCAPCAWREASDDGGNASATPEAAVPNADAC
jgi:hypothetical protein